MFGHFPPLFQYLELGAIAQGIQNRNLLSWNKMEFKLLIERNVCTGYIDS